jgi:Carboxypeptidase regulatory-like domain
MKSDFNCSQSDFILVVTAGLNSFFNFLPQFALYNKQLTDKWGDTMRTDLAAAEAMPDEDTRNANQREKATKVAEKAEVGRMYWQQMKDYIIGAYPENLVEIKLTAAGQKLYKEAGNSNWPINQQMFASATRFMTANLAALNEADQMPSTFPADFEAAIQAFRNELSEYETMKTDNMVGSQERIAALNNIHKRFMVMMNAGQKIFKDNPAVYTQFVFADVLSRVGGHRLAGIEGKVTDDAANLPLSGALVKLFLPDFPETAYTGITDDDGAYIANSPSGTYTVTVSKPGYATYMAENMRVEVGTVSRMNVKLVPEEEKEG